MMGNAESPTLVSTVTDTAPATLPFRAATVLAWREILRFFRQGTRVVGAIGQPVIFWVFFGAGFDRAFHLEGSGGGSGASFAAYYFPGTLVLILLFTAIFSTISVIEDRREGFLQSVLVAPLPRWSMVLGKVVGGSILAVLQGWLFLLLALTLNVDFTLWKLVQISGLMMLASLGLTSLGFSIAWRMESTQGFHAIMTVFLMPLWLLSGAFFPVPALTANSSWMQFGLHWMMKCNPLTFTVAGMHQLLYDRPLAAGLFMPAPGVCWLVTGAAALLMFAIACRLAASLSKGDLL
ncbi:MAG: ABC transporter permease [Planctomycetes bacterium]|nr:ABC transporter permease [Planctomycetota bacterium]